MGVMGAILRHSVPEKEFDFVDKCFPEGSIEHKARYSIIIGHIYLDVKLHSILEKFNSQKEEKLKKDPEEWRFWSIVEYLHKHKKISKTLFDKLYDINEARKAFAHELWPSSTTFHDKYILGGDGMQEIRKAILESYEELKKINS